MTCCTHETQTASQEVNSPSETPVIVREQIKVDYLECNSYAAKTVRGITFDNDDC